MTYREYQQYMAKYGFSACPLLESEFTFAKESGATDDQLYGIGCDVSAGIRLQRAIEINTREL